MISASSSKIKGTNPSGTPLEFKGSFGERITFMILLNFPVSDVQALGDQHASLWKAQGRTYIDESDIAYLDTGFRDPQWSSITSRVETVGVYNCRIHVKSRK